MFRREAAACWDPEMTFSKEAQFGSCPLVDTPRLGAVRREPRPQRARGWGPVDLTSRPAFDREPRPIRGGTTCRAPVVNARLAGGPQPRGSRRPHSTLPGAAVEVGHSKHTPRAGQYAPGRLGLTRIPIVRAWSSAAVPGGCVSRSRVGRMPPWWGRPSGRGMCEPWGSTQRWPGGQPGRAK